MVESHLFLKLKHDATIKGRMVARSNKQCSYISKEEAATPTASLESVMLTSVIDVQKSHDTVIADVPNTFI